MIEHLTTKIVKIRKERQCLFCLRTSVKGAKMNVWEGKIDNDFIRTYSCLTCDEIVCKHCREDGDDGYPEGFVYEMLEKNQTPEQLLETLNLSKLNLSK